MSSDIIASTLKKWYDIKKKQEIIDEKIKKYKAIITAEMNKKEIEKISRGEFSVSRRRQTRTSLSKESVSKNIWDQYSTKSHFDVLTLVKMK